MMDVGEEHSVVFEGEITLEHAALEPLLLTRVEVTIPGTPRHPTGPYTLSLEGSRDELRVLANLNEAYGSLLDLVDREGASGKLGIELEATPALMEAVAAAIRDLPDPVGPDDLIESPDWLAAVFLLELYEPKAVYTAYRSSSREEDEP